MWSARPWDQIIQIIILKHVIRNTGDIIINSNSILISYSGELSEKYDRPGDGGVVLRTMIKLIPILLYGYDFVSGNERLADDVTRWTVGIGSGGRQTYIRWSKTSVTSQ